MVHKKFVNPPSTREHNWIDRTPNPAARNYLDEMAPINGFHEDNSESIRMRDSFRDEVSKRMGELLLKGQTMLDEYCPTCNFYGSGLWRYYGFMNERQNAVNCEAKVGWCRHDFDRLRLQEV
uniref:Uncharacterized protein n=1 Tax=Caenorhabditis japonica TaxID=281687 RepID=A0A8R1I9C2_CAEJA